MTFLRKILTAIAAIAGALFFFYRRRELEVKADVDKDNAEALPVAAVVAKLEGKVADDGKTADQAVADYDAYRASHPIGGDGGGSGNGG